MSTLNALSKLCAAMIRQRSNDKIAIKEALAKHQYEFRKSQSPHWISIKISLKKKWKQRNDLITLEVQNAFN